MLRRYLFVFYLLLIAVSAQAQVPSIASENNFPSRELSPYSVVVRGGATQFFGELNTQQMKFLGGVGLIRHITPTLNMSLDFTTGQLGGKKEAFFNSYFVNKFSSVELLAGLDLIDQFDRFDRTRRLNLTAYTGIGIMYFSSNAYDLTTNERVRFTNGPNSGRNPIFARWGSPQGNVGVSKTHERTVPLGLMLGVRLSQTWMLGVDYRLYLARTDKLDATSGRRLINPEESNSYSDTPNDKYSFLSVSITHRFTRLPKDSDGDGVPDSRDRCPDSPGTAEFYGCPDSDGDGIPDNADRCPTEPGSAAARGCPDADGDGIIDRYDECPDVAGKLKGCPDRDGDGVRDEYDGCPDVKGLLRFGGCPDTDGDGIPDHVDKCPNQPGKYEDKGCPVGEK